MLNNIQMNLSQMSGVEYDFFARLLKIKIPDVKIHFDNFNES